MCGIAGIINSENAEQRKETVKGMLSRISYRGPDQSGIFHSDFATIGNVRLSIIDVMGGQQPLSDTYGRYWIVFNGEIFNYIELKQELISRGISFSGDSDTEVIVQLFSLYGKDCVNRLNGQFAFAIWDRKEKSLFIARDRVGIRPLFYHVKNGILSFASEIKSLLANPEIEAKLSIEKISQIFTFWATITPGTAFTNIWELPPGHYLFFKDNKISIEKYWELKFGKNDHIRSVREAVSGLDELFEDSIRIRLRADVKVAAYLSGGIDSSATVAYINQIDPSVLNTFSIGFKDKDYDETSFQREAASYFNTRHKSITISTSDIANAFPKAVWHAETPLLRTAPVPMCLLSKLVKDSNIKVVITGEGADEMLAGYNIFKESEVRRFWSRQPDSLIRPLLLKKLYPYLPQMANANSQILKMFFGYKLEDIDNPFYSHLLRWNNARHITKHFSAEVKKSLISFDPLREAEKILPSGFDNMDSLSKAQWLESSIFMSGYLLSSQGDRMGMANSIEGRYPFLDHRIIEYCASLPPTYKMKGLNEKYLLKQMVKGKIPDNILNRSKQAYRAPVSSAFISKNAPDYVKELLSEKSLENSGYFDFKSINAMLRRIEKTGKSSEIENMTIAAVLSTQLLHHQFIDGNSGESGDRILNNMKIVELFK